MLYKTIVLELLVQRPLLHRQLIASGTLLSTVESQAAALKHCHGTWMKRLATPESNPTQISSEAMEHAIQEFQEHLPNASAPGESLSLAAAMEFIRRHTPSDS